MYESTIPDSFVPRQFRDDRFTEAVRVYSDNGHRAAGPWICALPRPDLDPSSRVHFDLRAGHDYNITAKTDEVAVMHVLSKGPGRVRLGYREHIPVSNGDLVLINLREAGHWIYIEGMLTYWFTADVAMARIYRTDKPLTPPLDPEGREQWRREPFWNLKDMLNDYVVLAQDPQAELEYRNGAATRIVLPDSLLADGLRSDNARDNRFPVVYRRVLGVGPGRVLRRESDLGVIDREETKSEAEPGDMMCYARTVAAAKFTFQSMPLEVIHAASILDVKDGPHALELHQSVALPLRWDMPTEDE